MTRLEEWERWNASQLVADDYELKYLLQDRNGLKIVFAGLETEVTIVYREQILSFRSCDESDRWKTVSDVLAGHGKDSFRHWLAYRVTASDYASWFAHETFDSTTADEILHLAFVTANDVIDVLSLAEPDILLSPIRD